MEHTAMSANTCNNCLSTNEKFFKKFSYSNYKIVNDQWQGSDELPVTSLYELRKIIEAQHWCTVGFLDRFTLAIQHYKDLWY